MGRMVDKSKPAEPIEESPWNMMNLCYTHCMIENFRPSMSSDTLTRSVILGDKLASCGVSDWLSPFCQRVSEWENLHVKKTCKKY